MAGGFACEACGFDWFTEERVIQVARPSSMPELATQARKTVYRLKCVNCGRFHYPHGDFADPLTETRKGA
jgi:uncharacterized Zn finger protein